MRKIIAGIVLAPLTVLALAACGEVAAPVSDKADKGAAVVKESAEAAAETGAGNDSGNDVEAEEPTDETASLGDTVEVGDWSVKVTEVVKNADAVLANRDYYNDKPKGQFVLVTYEATYSGPERTADTFADLTWTLTTNDHKVWDTAYATTPADDQEWTSEARKGGMVKQQAVFDVNAQTLPQSILSVEGYDTNFDSVFADFKV